MFSPFCDGRVKSGALSPTLTFKLETSPHMY
jgi:hypothetical protein